MGRGHRPHLHPHPLGASTCAPLAPNPGDATGDRHSISGPIPLRALLRSFPDSRLPLRTTYPTY